MQSKFRRGMRLLPVILVTVLAWPLSTHGQILVNGSFESNFTGWTTSGVVGISTTYGASDGVRAAAFNGGNAVGSGLLTQSFFTLPGTAYEVEFDYGVYGAARTQQLQVTTTGSSPLLNTTVNRTGTGDFTPGSTQYTTSRLPFTADGYSAQLDIQDVTDLTGSNSADGMLDRVSVHLAPQTINPGGNGTLGTVNYVGGNIALGTTVAARGGATTSSIDGEPTTRTWGASTAGGNDGAGQNSGFSGTHSWHTNSQGGAPDPYPFFNVDFGDVSGTPNAGNQDYAIGSISIYSRTDCCTDQSDGLVDMFDATGASLFTNAAVDFNPNVLVTLDLADHGVRAGEIEYHNMSSFNELEVFGIADFSLGPDDTLEIDMTPTDNDYVNVEGDAVLDGTLRLNLVGGFAPAYGTTIDVLSALTIDASGLTLDTSQWAFGIDVLPGGSGEILRLTTVPEPSTLAMLLGLGTAALLGYLRRRR